MVDLSVIENQIPNVTSIWVISSQQETKELLIEINGPGNQQVHTVETTKKPGSTPVLTKQATQDIEINTNREFLVIPSGAISKSKSGNTLAQQFGLTRINKNYHFLFSNSMVEIPFGRCLKIMEKVPYKPKKIQKLLNDLEIESAEFLARDFFHKTADISKKIDVKKGGKHLLVFTNDINNNPWVIICLLK